MPKEKIYDVSELFDITVGWAHDRSVQIGIETHDGRSIADWLAGQEPHVPPSHPSAEGLPAGSKLPSFDSLWASLDRGGINRLIKALRKARDDAYGKDE
jgi:hypothetical protein